MPIDLSTLYLPKGPTVAGTPVKVPKTWGNKYPVGDSPDLQRILRLPRRLQEQDDTDRARALIQMIADEYGKGDVPCRCAEIDPERHKAEGCIKTPRLVQAQAVWDISVVGGLFGVIVVGQGKTLIDLLAPLALARFYGTNNILCVLCCPPSLIDQLIDDYDYISSHWHLPSVVVQGKSREYDRIVPGMPKLQVMPYSRMQLHTSTDWLEIVRPTALILDEAHKATGKTSTGDRIAAWMRAHPATANVSMTGSPTKESIKDYYRLVKWSLKGNSPLPLDAHVIGDWARAIDPSASQAPGGALENGLIQTGFMTATERLEDGYRRRLFETRGVVSAQTTETKAALEIQEKKLEGKIPPAVLALIERALSSDRERPDGEQLVTQMQAVECAIQLACGVYYRWRYPGHVFPRDRQLIDEWFEIRKAWNKELRIQLETPKRYLDSKYLLERAAARHYGFEPPSKGRPNWPSLTYLEWRAIKDRVNHESEAVRMDPFLVNDVANFAHKEPAIIWYSHGAVAEWIAEVSGLPMFGGGKEAANQLREERGTRSAIVSLQSFGTGFNGLQWYFNRFAYPNPPADVRRWEQSLGRGHRPGQKKDTVYAYFWMHTHHLRKHVQTALQKCAYVEGTLGAPQKLRVGFPYDLVDDLED